MNELDNICPPRFYEDTVPRDRLAKIAAYPEKVRKIAVILVNYEHPTCCLKNLMTWDNVEYYLISPHSKDRDWIDEVMRKAEYIASGLEELRKPTLLERIKQCLWS